MIGVMAENTEPRVAHEPPYRRNWVAHTYDCRECGHWEHRLGSALCFTGAKLLSEVREYERAMMACRVFCLLRWLADGEAC